MNGEILEGCMSLLLIQLLEKLSQQKYLIRTQHLMNLSHSYNFFRRGFLMTTSLLLPVKMIVLQSCLGTLKNGSKVWALKKYGI